MRAAAAAGSRVTSSWVVRRRRPLGEQADAVERVAGRRGEGPGPWPVRPDDRRRPRPARRGRRRPRSAPCGRPARRRGRPGAAAPPSPRRRARPARRRRAPRAARRPAAASRRSAAPASPRRPRRRGRAPGPRRARRRGTPAPTRCRDRPTRRRTRTHVGAVGDGGDRRGDGRRWPARRGRRCARPGAAPAASASRSPSVGAGAADRHDRHRVAGGLGQPQPDLQRGPVGVGHAGPPLVAVDPRRPTSSRRRSRVGGRRRRGRPRGTTTRSPPPCCTPGSTCRTRSTARS